METELERVTRERDEAREERDSIAAFVASEFGQQYLSEPCYLKALAARDERMKRQGAVTELMRMRRLFVAEQASPTHLAGLSVAVGALDHRIAELEAKG
jgi:hypothetical protein